MLQRPSASHAVSITGTVLLGYLYAKYALSCTACFPEDGSGPRFRKDEVFKAVGKVKCMMGQGELATMEFACIGENTPCGSLALLLCFLFSILLLIWTI